MLLALHSSVNAARASGPQPPRAAGEEHTYEDRQGGLRPSDFSGSPACPQPPFSHPPPQGFSEAHLNTSGVTQLPPTRKRVRLLGWWGVLSLEFYFSQKAVAYLNWMCK